MSSKIKFEKISLIDNRIILSLKSKKEEVIYFSEIDKVYIKINKMHYIYYFLFLLTSIVVVILSLICLPFDLILLVPILVLITGAVKLNNHKIYGLKILLKDGRLFRQEVPLKLKYKTVETVNIVRQEIYINTINH
jgi:hypothetical protein